MYTHLPNKPEKGKKTLTPRQEADGICFLREETSADSGIHAIGEYSNVRVYCKTLK
jgi:hypothetical protein